MLTKYPLRALYAVSTNGMFQEHRSFKTLDWGNRMYSGVELRTEKEVIL